MQPPDPASPAEDDDPEPGRGAAFLIGLGLMAVAWVVIAVVAYAATG